MTSKAPLVKARPFPLSLFVPLVRSSALLHLLLPVGCRLRTLDMSTRNSCSLLSLASSNECPSVFNPHISSSKYHLSSTLVHAQCAPSRYQTIRHTGVRSSGIGPRDSWSLRATIQSGPAAGETQHTQVFFNTHATCFTRLKNATLISIRTITTMCLQ